MAAKEAIESLATPYVPKVQVSTEGMTMPRAAETLARKAHEDQKYGDLPYTVHLERVAELVESCGEAAVAVAWLHDAVEDTKLNLRQIARECGPVVAQCVGLLTDPPGKNRKERKALAYAELALIRVDDPRSSWTLLVKAADRLANVESCIRTGNAGLMKMYRDEQPAFRVAVHRPGFNDRFIEAIDALLGGP